MTQRVDFTMALEPLCEVVEQFLGRFREGLRQDGQELKCLPTYIPVSNCSRSQAGGEAYVLDLGGSNLRAGLFDVAGGELIASAAKAMPWQRGVTFSKQRFFQEQAELLASLPQRQAPLGYCFSYPAVSQSNGDARLVRWTKGVCVPDVEGTCVGEQLLDQLQLHYQRRLTSVAVINDTVASLLAGLTLEPVDCYAGLIAGTGMNLAADVGARHIGKLPNDVTISGRLPVNIESGNFTPPCLTEWDEMLDQASENPGEQRFEKAVGGMYLGRVFALANPDLAFAAESGARGLVELATTASDTATVNAALSIYRRSAQLVAAQLAALALFNRDMLGARSLRVVAEGGLAWSTVGSRASYFLTLTETLQALLAAFQLSDLNCEIVRIDNANMIGSAVAAHQLSRVRAQPASTSLNLQSG